MTLYRSFREIRLVLDGRITTFERIVSHYLDNITETSQLDVFRHDGIARARLVDKKISGVKSCMPACISDLICSKDHPDESAGKIPRLFITIFPVYPSSTTRTSLDFAGRDGIYYVWGSNEQRGNV